MVTVRVVTVTVVTVTVVTVSHGYQRQANNVANRAIPTPIDTFVCAVKSFGKLAPGRAVVRTELRCKLGSC